MNTPASLKPSHYGTRVILTQPEEIRRLVELGKQRGLIKEAKPGATVAIEKNGIDLAKLANVWMQKVDITPAMAAWWLKNNLKNRSLSKDVVTAYARDMVNGQWVFTHQGIAFNDKEELVDGQHRLHAIVAADKTIPMMVTFGLPSKIDGKEMTTMDCVDRGRTRSVSDQLTIQHGFKNGTITAAICAAIASICFLDRTRRLSVGQTLEVFREFEHPINWVIAHRSKQPGLRAGGVMAGFAFALAAEEARTGARFWEGKMEVVGMFESVMTGEKLRAGSPMELLRNFLTGEESKLFTPSLNRGLAELVMHAIHLQLHGKTVSKLELELAGADYFRSLQKKRVEKIAAIFRLPDKPNAIADEPTPAPADKKPSLAKILKAAEAHFKIAAAIITGRGEEPELSVVRTIVIHVALFYGHGFDAISEALRRTPTSVKKLHIDKKHMGAKQIQAIEAIKSRL